MLHQANLPDALRPSAHPTGVTKAQKLHIMVNLPKAIRRLDKQ
jgi:hypothetical protein